VLAQLGGFVPDDLVADQPDAERYLVEGVGSGDPLADCSRLILGRQGQVELTSILGATTHEELPSLVAEALLGHNVGMAPARRLDGKAVPASRGCSPNLAPSLRVLPQTVTSSIRHQLPDLMAADVGAHPSSVRDRLSGRAPDH